MRTKPAHGCRCRTWSPFSMWLVELGNHQYPEIKHKQAEPTEPLPGWCLAKRLMQSPISFSLHPGPGVSAIQHQGTHLKPPCPMHNSTRRPGRQDDPDKMIPEDKANDLHTLDMETLLGSGQCQSLSCQRPSPARPLYSTQETLFRRRS